MLSSLLMLLLLPLRLASLLLLLPRYHDIIITPANTIASSSTHGCREPQRAAPAFLIPGQCSHYLAPVLFPNPAVRWASPQLPCHRKCHRPVGCSDDLTGWTKVKRPRLHLKCRCTRQLAPGQGEDTVSVTMRAYVRKHGCMPSGLLPNLSELLLGKRS